MNDPDLEDRRKVMIEETGAAMIQRERNRQQIEEGYTGEHDAREEVNGELIQAAMAYLALHQPDFKGDAHLVWPWEIEFFKPKTPIRDLVRAGALIAAEIDRRRFLGEVG